MNAARILAGALALAALFLTNPLRSEAQPARPHVTDQTQLPRFAYPMRTAPSTLVNADDATFAAFSGKVLADVESTLRDYDIADKATLRDLLATKLRIQILNGEYAGAKTTLQQLRDAQTKDAQRLLSGRFYGAYLTAAERTNADSGSAFQNAFVAADRAATDALTWGVVADGIKQSYANARTITADVMIGGVKHDLDPIAAQTGTLDGPSAERLVLVRFVIKKSVPLYPVERDVLSAYIAKNNVVKPDIWRARDVTLAPAQVKAPVLIGNWDSGVDPSVYAASMYVDPNGTVPGQHGLALADDGTPSTLWLHPNPEDVTTHYPTDVKYLAGFSDLANNIDSPDAQAAAAYSRSLTSDQENAFEMRLDYVDQYVHGSHVAGIAIRGNPAARVVVARFDDNLPDLKFAPTMAWVQRMVDGFTAMTAYFRTHGVRVVNMSWGDEVSEFELWLARTDKTWDPQTRKAVAQQLYAAWRAGIERAIASAPDTLFVAAAGNSDSDASFDASIPSSLVLPNLLTVGAVNQAGDPTSFTSFGPTVAVYADGYEVLSKVPGGYAIRLSGTSMAAPNVTNLAGKLFALDPGLTATQARALIVDGATRSQDGKILLVDPKRSVALLQARR